MWIFSKLGANRIKFIFLNNDFSIEKNRPPEHLSISYSDLKKSKIISDRKMARILRKFLRGGSSYYVIVP